MNYYSILKNRMDQKNLPYREINNGTLEIIQQGNSIQNIRIVVGFGDGTSNKPWFKNYDLGRFDGDKYAAGLIACNDANKKYRWVRFFIDEDNDVVAEADAIVSDESVFDEVIELIVRMLNIIDDLYPSFMKARWA